MVITLIMKGENPEQATCWRLRKLMAGHRLKLKNGKRQTSRILQHVLNTVPYYISYWQNKLKANPNLNTLDLKNWPVVTKDIIRINPGLFVSKKYNTRSNKELFQWHYRKTHDIFH